MLIGVGTRSVGLLLIILAGALCLAQQREQKRPWKGYSVLGNGHLTAVYSDDNRITGFTKSSGIQHFYFKDYAADYIASTSFKLISPNGTTVESADTSAIGMKNFFTAQTQTPVSNGLTQTVLCFVHPNDTAVLSLNVTGGSGTFSYRFEARLRNEIKTDRTITLTSLESTGYVAVALWSNGTALAIAPKSSKDKVTADGSSVFVTGSLGHEGEKAEVLLVPGSSQTEALSKARVLQREKDLEAEAKTYWDSWLSSGRLPVFHDNDPDAAEYVEAYKRNLYCVKAANLNGQIPADITGQFVTNNMPQLYPRDAMMCARVLLLTGHLEEARQVIEFWASDHPPMKAPGEWYARYDAHAKVVDAGSGARFDEPEWDANGYYIYLLNEYHRATRVWLADQKLFYSLADFLVSHISPSGLLQEGGIVEWTGYLPATNMICAAALETAAKMAREFGDERRAQAYAAASHTISSALPQMFDSVRQTYADVRSTGRKGAHGESLSDQSGEKTYLWDTTANVGLIWGYPNHRAIELSNNFYAKNTVKFGGGMEYFDSSDPGLASYGHGLFLFTTAAAAEYETLYGRKSAAKTFIDWMVHNANSYGLMPEHIFPDDSDCSPASPLSWCSAEFAAALLAFSQR